MPGKGIAETARLIASLELKDKLGPGIASASRSLGKFEGRLGKMGRTASRGLSTLAGNLTKIGAVVAVGLGAVVKSGLGLLAEMENATTSVAGAISQMGLAGSVTAGQVATWAGQIEDATGAAFDEKPITRAAGTLIRFGKVTAGNLRPAMVIMTDLATKTGDVDSAASLLAKALSDPEKAAGKLARSGVVLTKEQQAQIKAFMKAGRMAQAQDVILTSLAKTTKDAALNSVGPYQRSLNELGDASEHVRMALGEGFLPVIMRIAAFLKNKLADPAVLTQIRSFGASLAGAFDKAVTFVEKIPWDSIGQGLKIAGAGAKAVFDAFTNLPPWVQTAVTTGWGLNKLTGGALSGIVGELGKGLIRGVLGLNAGVVHAKAGVVNVIGGAGGLLAGGAAAAGFGLVSAAAVVAILGSGAVMSWLALQKFAEENTRLAEQGLTPEQIQAKKLSEMSPADRARAEKSTAILPSNRTPEGRAANLAAGSERLAAGGGRGDAGTAALVLERGIRAGIAERGFAKSGKWPSEKSITATHQRNLDRDTWQRAVTAGMGPPAATITDGLADNAAAIATASAIAARLQAIASAVTNMRLGVIAAKDFSPKITVPVYVTSTVSVRGMSVAQSVRAAYNHGIHAPGAGR